MARNWTENQQQAIYKNGGTILVSAAAGSGKTAVLVERIINKITCENSIDIDKLLVVTFSNDAAKEMKERVVNALIKLYTENPANSNLKRQQVLMGRASISTVHSFCFDLIRNNYHALNLEPDFKVMDSLEGDMLKKQAIEKTIDDFYSDEYNENIDGKNNLSILLSDVKGDRKLINAINSLYNHIISFPAPEDELNRLSQMYNDNKFFSSRWIKIFLKNNKRTIKICLQLLNDIYDETNDIEGLQKNYNPSLKTNIDLLLKALECYNYSDDETVYTELFNLFQTECYKTVSSRVPKDCTEIVTQYKNSIYLVKKYMDEINDSFIFSVEEIEKDIEKNSGAIQALCNLTKNYKDNYDMLKRENNSLDFNDAEQFAIKLLADIKGNKFSQTSLAKELSKNYVEIMVDEFQDTNAVQDMIFRALSKKEKNLFMVGDAKQGIYSFRQANPDIFIHKKEDFNNIENEKYPAKIILSKNFRSRVGITKIINCVFSKLMSKSLGDIEYNQEEYLNPGATYPDENKCCVQFALIESEGKSKDFIKQEANYTAMKIKDMLDKKIEVFDGEKYRPCIPGDFCVMMRSTKNSIGVYLDEFAKIGVNAIADTDGCFFQAKEINIAISLLEAINNPLLDISLVATLMSPIFNFSATDIAKIKAFAIEQEKTGLLKENTSFYVHLNNYANLNDSNLSQKILSFLKIINKYRFLSATEKADILINQIFEETNLYNLTRAMLNGDERVSNLRVVISLAKKYESTGYKGLCSFIRYLSKLQEEKSNIETINGTKENNAVRFLTIHKSKGLEYPFCFICGLFKKINTMDLNSDIIVNGKNGIGMRIVEPLTGEKYKPLAFNIIANEMTSSFKSEEMRILYVALTRAKEKLFFVSANNKILEKVEQLKEQADYDEKIIRFIASKKSCYFDWLTLALVKHKAFTDIKKKENNIINDDHFGFSIQIDYMNEAIDTADLNDGNQIVEKNNVVKIDEKVKENIVKVLNFTYPYSKANNLTSKISVSELTKKENESLYPDELYIPSFIEVKNKQKTGAQRGTSMHKFLQIADFSLANNNVKQYADFALKSNKISNDIYNDLDFNSLKIFFQSNLVKEMINSKMLYKEVELLYKMKLKDIDNSIDDASADDEIIIQGIADCVFKTKDNKWILLDYKTDHVKDEQVLIERYKNQLNVYKLATENLLNDKIYKTLIYSFNLNREIEI